MAELGYHGNAKKCKEKFENVYKYRKHTKDGRMGKFDGKTRGFFNQLEALEHHHSSSSSTAVPNLLTLLPQPPSVHEEVVPVTMVMPAGATVAVPSSPHPVTVLHASPIVQQQQHQRVNPTHQIPLTSGPGKATTAADNVGSPEPGSDGAIGGISIDEEVNQGFLSTIFQMIWTRKLHSSSNWIHNVGNQSAFKVGYEINDCIVHSVSPVVGMQFEWLKR